MKEIIGLIAVRTDSTRLPGKAFRLIGGKPLIQILLERIGNTPYLDDFIVCTTTNCSDDELAEFCSKRDIKVVRGETENVLGRFVKASMGYPSKFIVRITGDNPLTDFQIMHETFENLKSKNADYSRPVGVPLGTACEIIRTSALYELHERTLSPEMTEYMTYFFELAPFISVVLYEAAGEVRFPDLRLTVDYENDLDFMEKIINHFGGAVVPLKEIVSYCRTLKSYSKYNHDFQLEDEIKKQIRFK